MRYVRLPITFFFKNLCYHLKKLSYIHTSNPWLVGSPLQKTNEKKDEQQVIKKYPKFC